MIRALELASLALAAAAALFVLILIARRLQLARITRRTEAAEERLRPVALAVLDGEEPDEDLSAADATVVASVLARYARRLSGEPREHIASYFRARGAVARELEGLHDRRSWRRASAAFALGDMGADDAVGALIEALADPEREVRSAAARSLGTLGVVAGVEPLVTALATGTVPRAVASGALLSIGPEAVPALITLAHSTDDRVRAGAIELIGLVGDAGDAGEFADRLRDAAFEVRAKTARALGRLGAEQAAVELRETLSDRIPDVRAAAAIALGDIGDRDAISPLWMQASEDRFEPARAAARAIAAIDPVVVAEMAERDGAGAHLAEAADRTAAGVEAR